MTQTTRIADHAAEHGRSLRGGVTLVAASAVALAVWAITVPVAGLDLTVGSGPTAQTVGPAAVAVVPLLVGGAAWGLLAFLARSFRNGLRAWRITAWVVLALSLLGPASSGASGAVLASLSAMHIAVGTVLIFGLAPTPTGRMRSR
ncbi:DUF6069 family protein [Micromonospora sp. NPDC048909]|uniref:DUF6069 family protein n=1 Tax=Micromonospora sp. NPDC048909 TaxID=3155643 RepID=UPI0033C3AB3D